MRRRDPFLAELEQLEEAAKLAGYIRRALKAGSGIRRPQIVPLAARIESILERIATRVAVAAADELLPDEEKETADG